MSLFKQVGVWSLRILWRSLFLLACLALVLWFLVTQPMRAPAFVVGDGPSDELIARLERHVKVLSEELPARAADAGTLEASAVYIEAQLQAAGATVRDQVFEVEGVAYRNIITEFGPRTGSRIVLGAHYDSAGGLPGADDNASGVAGLIELVRALAAEPPSHRIELVAYTLEEPPYFRGPFMGSAVHAASLKEAGADVRLMLALEMIGYFTDAPDSQAFPFAVLRPFYPSSGNFAAIVGSFGDFRLTRDAKRILRSSSKLPVYSINAPTFVPGIDFSDHLNYWAQDYPALMITDTAFYRNKAYHTREDTADRLDYRRMAQLVLGVEALIRGL